MSERMSTERLFEVGFQILSVLIVPVLLWVNSLSVRLALNDQTVSDHSEEIREFKKKAVQVELNTQALANIKEDIRSVRVTMEEIRKILEKRP